MIIHPIWSIILGLAIIVVVWYVMRYKIEPFVYGPGPGPEPAAKVIVAPVPKMEAMAQIKKNFDTEWNLIKVLEPYYEKLVTITAGNKASDPNPATVEAAKPQVRRDIESDTKGACIPVYEINRALKAINDNKDLSQEAKYVISYMYLPMDVKSYKTTIEFLNKKSIELYRYFTELGGKGSPTAAVQGSSAESMNIKIQGFQDGGSSPIASGSIIDFQSASIEAKGDLNKIIAATLATQDGAKKKAAMPPIRPVTEKTVQDLYHVTNTRMRLFNEYDINGQLLLDMKNNFDRLNTLMQQLQNPPDSAYAGITQGKSPEAALEGFGIIDPLSYKSHSVLEGYIGENNMNYAFLKY